MKFILQIIIEFLSVVIALCAGIFAYASLRPFQRRVFYQVLLWMLVYLGGYAITLTQRHLGLAQNNLMLMNFYLLGETAILLSAAKLLMRDKRLRMLINAALLLFILSFCIEVAIRGVWAYANLTDTLGCFMLIGAYAFAIYFSLDANLPWWRNANLYTCAAIVAYYACLVPLMSVYTYFHNESPSSNVLLQGIINDTMANVRYLLTAIGFWLAKGGTNG